MNYSQTLDYLFNSVTSFQQVGASAYKPGLERVEAFCSYMGNPERDFLSIHIAGTNGKGSTSHMIASVLQSAGYCVGLYTSPHLRDFRERMRVDGGMISEREVVEFVNLHRPKIEELGLSFFEITTVMAFDFFSKSGVEVAVIETGLGGRLDATNVILPLLSVVTNIGLDHTEFLGTTLPEIASEKAGIIKKDVAIVLGEGSEEYNHVFEGRAAECGSKLIYAQREFSCETIGESVMANSGEQKMQEMLLSRRRDGREYRVRLDLMGEWQSRNVVTASAALDYLHQHTALTIPSKAYLEGLSSVGEQTHLQGRWQTISREPLVVCDTGHNAHGLRYVAAELERCLEQYDRVICVIGFAKEKDLSKVLPLLPKRAYYIFTQAAVSRALPAEELAQAAGKEGLSGEVVVGVAEALQRAKQMAQSEDMIFVGGSNFVVAEIL
ncbi:MAG: bifunctional folylpolyglutamate synthase/dihydrofolate synthase [Alistipes sp.]|nr:bifunctional folylpolyglutamate synthase/dihydrofolate synthase [Alistipes sp.]